MGTIKKPQEAKLFAGIIAVSEVFAAQAVKELEDRYGPADIKSPAINFSFTDYYAAEMGGSLIRLWVGFEKLIDPGMLAAIKAQTNELEDKYSLSGKRQVNVDPGYVTPAKVVLASSKDFAHRVYLAGGIYGEVTLIFRKNNFAHLEWTYPDYKSETAVKFFTDIRKDCLDKLKGAL